jgi:hypothetical protein
MSSLAQWTSQKVVESTGFFLVAAQACPALATQLTCQTL